MNRHYASGNIQFDIHWMCMNDNATGIVVWEMGLRKLNTGEDLNSPHAFTFTSTTGLGGNNNVMLNDSITFNNTQADFWNSNEYAILRVKRESASSGIDTVTGDAAIVMINGYETI
jgi:hypothetical protein